MNGILVSIVVCFTVTSETRSDECGFAALI